MLGGGDAQTIRSGGWDYLFSHEEERARAEQEATGRLEAEECIGEVPKSLSTLCALAHVAGYTERVRLGTNSVNLPYRNATTTPEQLATRDVLS